MAESKAKWQRLHPVLIYLPVVPAVVRICFQMRLPIRSIFQVNPAFKYGGATIDSKWERYQLFKDAPFFLPTVRVDLPIQLSGGDLQTLLKSWNLRLPIIVKPDFGFMSRGVRKVDSGSDLTELISTLRGPYLIQQFSLASREYAVYYYRVPRDSRGTVLDVTERVLPFVVGNGHQTIAQLIKEKYGNNRTSSTISHRYSGLLNHILEPDKRLTLANSATGRQGAIFVKSHELITSDLVSYFDAVTKSAGGFFLGKFDLKVDDPIEISGAGHMELLEVNGVTSELNYLFDSQTSYIEAYKAIKNQFRILYSIANENRSIPMPGRLETLREFINVLTAKYED